LSIFCPHIYDKIHISNKSIKAGQYWALPGGAEAMDSAPSLYFGMFYFGMFYFGMFYFGIFYFGIFYFGIL